MEQWLSGNSRSKGERIAKEHKETSQLMDMFIILSVVMVSWVYTYIKIHQMENFKNVQLIRHPLYFNKL